MSMDDQALLLELPLPVDHRPPQTARGKSTLGPDEKRGRLTRPSPAASPMDLDDPLSEILLRLPPLPSSLPRASLVCTRCRRLVTDPGFIRRFRAHHWKPLGVFLGGDADLPLTRQKRKKDLSFSFFLGSAPPERFSVRVPRECHEGAGIWNFLGCRHGRVVLANCSGYGYGTRQILVWNPVTGEDHLLEVSQFWDSPSGFHMQAAVICASGHNGPFKLALAWEDMSGRSSSAHICAYSSETGVWGSVVSTAILQPWFVVGRGNVMVGNTLYWILFGGRVRILEFDLDSQNLSVIEVPQAANDYGNHCGVYLCTLAKDGGLSLMVMSENLRGELWVWEKTADGGFQWILGQTIELDMLLSLRSEGHRSVLWLEGDDNVMFVPTYKGIFMVYLQSMQFEKIFETDPDSHRSIFPFKYLHDPGDILHRRGVGSGVQVSGQGHAEDRADRQAPHVSIKEGGAQAYIAGLKRPDAHVSWEGAAPVW